MRLRINGFSAPRFSLMPPPRGAELYRKDRRKKCDTPHAWDAALMEIWRWFSLQSSRVGVYEVRAKGHAAVSGRSMMRFYLRKRNCQNAEKFIESFSSMDGFGTYIQTWFSRSHVFRGCFIVTAFEEKLRVGGREGRSGRNSFLTNFARLKIKISPSVLDAKLVHFVMPYAYQ